MFPSLRRHLRPYAPLFLRLGLGIVYLLFGLQKFTDAVQGQANVRLLLDIGPGAASVVNFAFGVIEILIAASFLLGAFVHFWAFVATVLTVTVFFGIVAKHGLSLDPTLDRDFALIGANIALFLTGAGPLSWDHSRERAIPISTPEQ